MLTQNVVSTRSKQIADLPICNIAPEPIKDKYVIAEGEAFVVES